MMYSFFKVDRYYILPTITYYNDIGWDGEGKALSFCFLNRGFEILWNIKREDY
jgi:hypothetical protein